MQTAISRSLLILILLPLTSTSYGASVSVKWTGRVPTMDTPHNVTLKENTEVVWEMNGKEYSKALEANFESELRLTVTQVGNEKLISYDL